VALSLSFIYGHLVPLLPRYSVWSTPFLMVLLAAGISHTGRARLVGGGVLGVYLLLDLLSLRTERPGYMLSEAARLGACSAADRPVEVRDPLHGFLAATARGTPVFFRVNDERVTNGLIMDETVACRTPDTKCDGVRVCGALSPRPRAEGGS
jgi:hypothetical protein